MNEAIDWHERYTSGRSDWDIGRPDFNLSETVIDRPVQTCKALDVGCGTGDNALWLARRGFIVTGTDITEVAIQRAREKVSGSRCHCKFHVGDFLNREIDGAPFGFVFDRGCFHSFDSREERGRFVEQAAFHLESGGIWLTLVGSADDPPRDTGPPRRSALDIVNAVEPHFEILSLYASHFDSNDQQPPGAWVCLMRKRNEPVAERHS